MLQERLFALHCKNVVYYMTLRSANHTVIRVVNTTQCHIIHQLVWYAHFIFCSVVMLSAERELAKTLDYNDIINSFAVQKSRKALLQ